MPLPASDSFTGADNDPLSSSWTIIDGSWKIFSNRANATSGANSGNCAYWNPDTVNADQYTQVKVYPSTYGTSNAGPAVRLASLRGYFANVGASNIAIYRLDGDEIYVLLQNITGLTVSDGDTVKLSIQGSTLKAYLNGVQQGTDQADSTYLSGWPGMFAYYGNTEPSLDDFFADNLATGGAGPSPIFYRRRR